MFVFVCVLCCFSLRTWLVTCVCVCVWKREVSLFPSSSSSIAHTHAAPWQVFDGTSFTQLRTLGAGLLRDPYGVCVDGGARVYVCDYSSIKAVVVLDGASGARLATIAVPGRPLGVRVTRTGAIVVTHIDPYGVVVIGPS